MKLCKRNLISYLNNMNETKKRVIIWGVDDYNTLGLFRELGKYNSDITFLIFQGIRHCATLSKYCTNYIETLKLEDGLNYLLNNKQEGQKAVIINSNDLIAEFLDRNREILSEFYVVPGTSTPGSLTKLDDKATMTKMAEELGFDVPKSIECKWDSNIDDVEYPCLLKPTHQTLGKFNEFKFKVCKDKKALKKTLRFVRRESTFILQQYIPKESVALVYGCRTMDGKIHLAGVLEKDRFCDNGDGSHGVLLGEFPPYIKPELIETFLNKVDFYGLFSVEYLVYKAKAYFIEVNWRNDGTSHLFYQAGANMPLLWVMAGTNCDTDSIGKTVSSKTFFIDEIFDKENLKRKAITQEQWKKESDEATVYKYYDKDDMAPYNAVKKRKLKKIILDSIVAKNRMYIVYIFDKLGIKRGGR